MDRRSDASLVAGAVAGERNAVAAIWDRYSALVRGVLYGALGGDEHVEDLVQEVFLSFLRGVARVQEGAALRGYLVGIAVRSAALEIRKRKVRRWVGLTPTGELPELPSARVDHEHRAVLAALHRTLQKLSHRRRMAFVLRHVQGLELQEAAEALEVSESTLRRELKYALDFLHHSREPELRAFLANIARQGT